MLTDHELDQAIKMVIQEEIDHQSVPPGARERVRQTLGLNQLQRTVFGSRIVVIAAAAVLVLVLLSFSLLPPAATALKTGLINRIEYLVRNRLFNIGERYGENPQMEPEQATPPEVIQAEQVTLPEARARLPFVLLVPDYLPEGLQLTSIQLKGSKPLMDVTLTYTGTIGTIRIIESGISTNTGFGIGYDADDTQVERLEINGIPATMMANKSGRTFLIWYNQGVTYRIEGTVSPTEIIKIAKNISPSGT